VVKKYYIPKDLDPNQKLKYIAKKYNISISTASKWRKAIRNNEKEKIQRDFCINSRMLGIFWAIGRDDGENFILRHRNKEIIEEVRDHFDIDNQIIEAESRTGVQHRLKLTGDIRENIIKALKKHDWAPRNADIRPYPKGAINHETFIKTYIELHSSLDYPKNRPRLRVYGNKALITEMNNIIPRIFDVRPKTPQKITKKTYCLYYQRKTEIEQLLDKNV